MDPSFYIPPQEKTFLSLTRPIVFFDLETTGTSATTDRIVEICAIKIHEDGSKEEFHQLINPTIPISPEATAVHGITDEMVAGEPTFGDLAEKLASFFTGCDLGGYNIRRFDVPMLMEEFYRHQQSPIDVSTIKLVDAMGIYHHKEKRDLSAAVRFYCNREHEGAHSAKADVLATIDILKQQLLKYEDLEPNTSFLHDYLSAGNEVDFAGKFTRDGEGRIIFNFGKYKGKEACSEPDFLKWMLDKDFTTDTKLVAQRIYRNCIAEDKCRSWLNEKRKELNETALAALYTALRFEQEIFPFSVKRENLGLTVIYLVEPVSVLHLDDADSKRVLLNILDNYFSKKGWTVPS